MRPTEPCHLPHACLAQCARTYASDSAGCSACSGYKKQLVALDWRVHRLESFRMLIQDDVIHLRESLGLRVPFLSGDPALAAAALASRVPARLARLEESVTQLTVQVHAVTVSSQGSCNSTQVDSTPPGADLGDFRARLQRLEEFLTSLAGSLASMPPWEDLCLEMHFLRISSAAFAGIGYHILSAGTFRRPSGLLCFRVLWVS